MKLLLLFLVFQCFETSIGGYAGSDLVYNNVFNWDKSCENHPFAIAGKSKNIMKDKTPEITCSLTFDYSTTLVKTVTLDAEEATTFCQHQHPDQFVDWSWSNKQLVCNYRRFRFCKNPKAIVLGNYCVFLLRDAATRADAAKKCAQVDGSKVLNIDTERFNVHKFLMRTYKWNQPTNAMWYDTVSSKNSLMYTDYGAIGSYRPGQVVPLDAGANNTKASVVCFNDANTIPGEKINIFYCDMMKGFLIIRTYQNADKTMDGTCYYLTQSLMHPKQSAAHKQLVTVDHFHSACTLRNARDKKYAVFPSSKFQVQALTNLMMKKQGHEGKLSHVLLAGAQEEYWGRAPKANHDETVDSVKYSMFSYTRLKPKQTKLHALETETAGFSAHLWTKDYPIDASSHTPSNWGALVWTKDGEKYGIKNVWNYRRAPIACATGIQMAEFYECPPDWELVERPEEKTAFCMKAFDGKCASYSLAIKECEKIEFNGHKGLLAPAATDEELAAISGAVHTWNPHFKYKSVLIGGHNTNEHGYVWDYDSKKVEYGWAGSQPDKGYRKYCGSGAKGVIVGGGNWIISKGSKLIGGGEVSIFCDDYYDGVVAVRFNWNGNVEGLIDVVGYNPCYTVSIYESALRTMTLSEESPTIVKGYVCAVEAKNTLVKDSEKV